MPYCEGVNKKIHIPVMPEEGENILRFTSFHRGIRVPYIVYVDFEALNESADIVRGQTRQLSMQTPCSYCFTVVRSDGQIQVLVLLYRGEGTVEKFLNALRDLLDSINEVFKHPKITGLHSIMPLSVISARENSAQTRWKTTAASAENTVEWPTKKRDWKVHFPAIMESEDWNLFNATENCMGCNIPFYGDKKKLFDDTDWAYLGAYHKWCKPLRKPYTRAKLNDEEKQSFAGASECHLCNKPFGPDKMGYQCRLTGVYRGAAHSACNVQLSIKPYKTKVPIVIHNLRGYDGHLIMQAIGKTVHRWEEEGEELEKPKKITCIPNNIKKYMTFGYGQLQFIDSMQFMNSSLDKIAANLKEYPITTKHLHNNLHLKLLTRKGVYPYEYIDSHARFEEKRSILQPEFTESIFLIRIVYTLRMYSMPSDAKRWVTITMSILRQTSFSWPTCSKHFEIHPCSTMSWIWLTTSPRQDCHGAHY